jgi:hypothetical protein
MALAHHPHVATDLRVNGGLLASLGRPAGDDHELLREKLARKTSASGVNWMSSLAAGI